MLSSALLLGVAAGLTFDGEIAGMLPVVVSRSEDSVLVLGVWLLESLSFSLLALAEVPSHRFRKPPWATLLPVVPASLNCC